MVSPQPVNRRTLKYKKYTGNVYKIVLTYIYFLLDIRKVYYRMFSYLGGGGGYHRGRSLGLSCVVLQFKIIKCVREKVFFKFNILYIMSSYVISAQNSSDYVVIVTLSRRHFLHRMFHNHEAFVSHSCCQTSASCSIFIRFQGNSRWERENAIQRWITL